jgi:hypothetical protein
MSAATLSPDTTTPTLPFDFDGFDAALAEEEARNADRKLCQEYLGNWTANFGKSDREKAVGFEAFKGAAARLSAASAA